MGNLLSEERTTLEQFPPETRVLVLGCGNFGTCLADHLASMGTLVTIFSRNPSVATSINESRVNSKYLPHFQLNDNVSAVSVLDETIFLSSTVVLVAIPTQNMRTFLRDVKQYIRPEHLLIFVNKGIEMATNLLPCDIVEQELGKAISDNATFLSVGPSFAVEVMARQPTAVAVASNNPARAKRAQQLFHAPHFRVYDVHDTVGVEIAGALKNVVAIAAGCCSGMGYGMNARAAIITRGLAEIARFGVALGANPLTFSGLAGVGDLFLTATSEKSRNFTVGFRIGQGEKLDDIIASLGSVSEGVPTTKAAYHLAQKLGIDAPITEQVYAVLYENKDLKEAIEDLTGREAHHELRGITH
ncbi:6-phosphogluconate dehydrogenase [Gorgonomyces haynaldii]|nr:6-phosphogluconate dehydrogenase [Gorgonomyces haynaldii]